MPHATHKARRILTSDVPHAPVKRRRSRLEQQVLLTAAVSFTMLIIVSLYVASFKMQQATLAADADYPRWSMLEEDFLQRTAPVKDNLSDVKLTLQRLVGTGTTQVRAATILKAKIEARVAASGTPETSETPETPETP